MPQVDPTTGEITVKVTLNPPTVTVTEPNTTIHYQLVEPTPAELQFTGVTIAPPNDQLGPPDIGTDGRSLTLNDVNTVPGDFVVTFQFNTGPEPEPMLRGMPDLTNRPKR
jgi:hypothetical protein